MGKIANLNSTTSFEKERTNQRILKTDISDSFTSNNSSGLNVSRNKKHYRTSVSRPKGHKKSRSNISINSRKHRKEIGDQISYKKRGKGSSWKSRYYSTGIESDFNLNTTEETINSDEGEKNKGDIYKGILDEIQVENIGRRPGSALNTKASTLILPYHFPDSAGSSRIPSRIRVPSTQQTPNVCRGVEYDLLYPQEPLGGTLPIHNVGRLSTPYTTMAAPGFSMSRMPPRSRSPFTNTNSAPYNCLLHPLHRDHIQLEEKLINTKTVVIEYVDKMKQMQSELDLKNNLIYNLEHKNTQIETKYIQMRDRYESTCSDIQGTKEENRKISGALELIQGKNKDTLGSITKKDEELKKLKYYIYIYI